MLDTKNVLAAFSEDHVERLTGLSKSQLRYWDRTGFFSPSYAEENRRLAYSRLYSFKDLVALRTLAVLRRQYGVPLQHLRKVADKLAHLEDELWTKTTLYVLNKEVVFDEPGSGRPRAVVSGQYVVGLPLERIVSDTERDVRAFKRRSHDQIGKVVRSRSVSRNAWVISGTRIRTETIRRLHEDGYSREQIRDEFPDLTLEDIDAALEHEEARGVAA